MPKWRTISACLALALLTLGVLMVLRIISLTEDSSKFDERLNSLSAQTVRSLVSDVRELTESNDNPNSSFMLFMLLLQEAWYYPDESVEPLCEAFESGKRLYWDFEMVREIIGPDLAYAYLYAGLPAQLDDWQTQVATHVPHQRYRLRFLQVAGKLKADDLQAARQLVENELEVGATTPRAKAFALQCNLMLEDYDSAKAIEINETTIAAFDLNQLHAYAEVLMLNGEYMAAVETYQKMMGQALFSPEHHLSLAVPMTVLSGIAHPQVKENLRIAATTTRQRYSSAGVEAVVFSELIRIDPEGSWQTDLASLSNEHPEDYWVQNAYLESQLNAARQTLLALPIEAQHTTQHQQSVVVPSVSDLMDLAQTTSEKQFACLLQATASAYRYYSDPSANQDGLTDSLTSLRRALGCPQTEGAIECTRIPDYELFILDPVINQLRSMNPDYNAGINHAVVDNLRRVQKRYVDEIEPKQIEYRVP